MQKMPSARAWYFAFPDLSLLLWLRHFPQGLSFTAGSLYWASLVLYKIIICWVQAYIMPTTVLAVIDRKTNLSSMLHVCPPNRLVEVIIPPINIGQNVADDG